MAYLFTTTELNTLKQAIADSVDVNGQDVDYQHKLNRLFSKVAQAQKVEVK